MRANPPAYTELSAVEREGDRKINTACRYVTTPLMGILLSPSLLCHTT